jgi:hypothetical protein
MLHTHLYLHVAVIRKASGKSLKTFKKALHPQNRGALDEKVLFHFFYTSLDSDRILYILR